MIATRIFFPARLVLFVGARFLAGMH